MSSAAVGLCHHDTVIIKDMYFLWGGLGRVKTKMVEGKNISYFPMSISQAKYDISLEQAVTSTIRNNCFSHVAFVCVYKNIL